MFFGTAKEKQPTTINEALRRRTTDNVLNEAGDMLHTSAVQDALEEIRLPHLSETINRMYVPTISDGEIHATRRGFVPLISIYPNEKLHFDTESAGMVASHTEISLLHTTRTPEALGKTYRTPMAAVALAMVNAQNANAPLVAIHELAHVYQHSHAVDMSVYDTYRDIAPQAEELQALNVESVVARALVGMRGSRWENNFRLFTQLSKELDSRPPLIRSDKKSIF